MPPRFPRIFLSASFSDVDRPVLEWFRDFIEAHDFEVVTADHPEPRPPEDKIRSDIASCDALAGLLTRRDKVEGEDRWTAPPWVYSESGIARELRKPIVGFLEANVEAEGLNPWVADYVRFDRRDLGRAAPRIARFLMSTRSLLVPNVALLEELPTIRSLAVEMQNEVQRLCRIHEKPDTTWRLSAFLAATSGRIYGLPPDLREDFSKGQTALKAIDSAVERVKKFDLFMTPFGGEKAAAKEARLANRAAALQDLVRERDANLPIVAKSAAALTRAGFPERLDLIEYCDKIATGEYSIDLLTRVLPALRTKGEDDD